LIAGEPGLGQKTIAYAFAAERGVNIGVTDADAFKDRGDLLGALTNLGEGDVMFISNIGALNEKMREFIRPALKDFRCDFVVDKGIFARTLNIPLKQFTCIGATESERELPRELREMFHLTISLKKYSDAELRQICQLLVQRSGLSVTPAATALIARASGGSPHQAEVLIHRLSATGNTTMTEEDVAHLLSVLGVQAPPISTTGEGTADLNTVSGTEFEGAISVLLQRLGFRTEMTQASGDGGIDIVATLERPIIGGRYLIQCKRFALDALVGSPTVREFYGALTADRKAVKGILITTSGFTAQAREFAENLPIELVDGEQLRQLLSEHGTPL